MEIMEIKKQNIHFWRKCYIRRFSYHREKNLSRAIS